MTSDTLTPAVAALLRKAADVAILPRYRTLADHQVTAKAVDDVVTVADHDSEAILAEGLARLLPGAAIVGEEATHADPTILTGLHDRQCWIIDPLDGTNNFAAGKPPFGIIIALVEGGETMTGWLYDPMTGRLCHAHAGQGAFVNGQRIQAHDTSLSPPVAAISLLFMDPAKRKDVAKYIAPHYRVVDIPRCAAEQYPRLVLGENDVSIFERTLPWDHAAGILFVNEAGGMAARPDGSPYRVTEHERTGLIAAATPALWQAMAERLNAIEG